MYNQSCSKHIKTYLHQINGIRVPSSPTTADPAEVSCFLDSTERE